MALGALIRFLTCHPFAPRTLLVLLLATGIGTMAGTYRLAEIHGHITKDNPYPSVYEFAENNPEHLLLGGGFSLIAIETFFIGLLAWLAMRARIEQCHDPEISDGEGRHTFNSVTFGFGCGVLPFLIVASWVPPSVSTANIITTAAWYIGFKMYQAMFLLTRLVVFCFEPGVRNATSGDIIRYLYFVACFVASLSLSLVWLTNYDKDNRLEYIFLGVDILFFMGLWPDFSPANYDILRKPQPVNGYLPIGIA